MQNELKKNIGIIARTDNSGLGVMTLDFFRNIPVKNVLVVYSRYENKDDRFDDFEGTKVIKTERGVPTLKEIDQFLEGLDVVVAFETPYNWNIFSRAKEKGIKTVLVVMYEWLPIKEEMPVEPDIFLCPTQLDYDTAWGNKVLLPTPVNRLLTPFKERFQAKTFFFNNGHGGFGNRNSLPEFLQAISLVESDVQFIIRSQVFTEAINDSRVTILTGDMSYMKLWESGDIYVHLHKFDGLSLPLNEAMAAGTPTIAVNTGPYAELLPRELLIEPTTLAPFKTIRPIKAAVLNPVDIAKKIDEVAKMDSGTIKKFSQRMNELADTISWKTLRPRYIEFFNNL